MRIAFFINTIPFNDQSLDVMPLGGTETGVVCLARALSRLGHDVVVLTRDSNPPLSSPLYVSIEALPDLGQVDLFVAIRDWNFTFLPLRARLKMLWTGDAALQPFTRGLGDKQVVENIDTLLTVSEWHARHLCDASGFPRDKAYVLGNGIEPTRFVGKEERGRKRMFYSSVPYRGLQLMPIILDKLVQKHPDVEFHNFGGFKVYMDAVGQQDKDQYDRLLGALSRFPQFVHRGNLTQAELAREMMRSSILCYPNTFIETSCITALEAQAAGCAVVTSDRGALPETVGESGILIPGEPGSAEYVEKFVGALDRLLTSDSEWRQRSDAGRRRSASFYWSTIAARFSDFIESKTRGH